jgi:hypothetical protein
MWLHVGDGAEQGSLGAPHAQKAKRDEPPARGFVGNA